MTIQWTSCKEQVEDLIDADGIEGHEGTIETFNEISSILDASDLQFAAGSEAETEEEAEAFINQFTFFTPIETGRLESGYKNDFEVYLNHGKKVVLIHEEADGSITVYRDKVK